MNSKKMVLTALLIAVVTVTTMVVNIPLPGCLLSMALAACAWKTITFH
jgi:uncharacterized membrane protein